MAPTYALSPKVKIDDLDYIRLTPNFLVSISLYYVLRIIEEQILVIREVRVSDDKLNEVR